MAVTISDVARSAGVSIKTVSRVVNNEVNVAESTRKRVLSVIEALGYTPNPSAQRLARGQAGLIGLIFHDATAAYVMDVLNGLLAVGEDYGYRVSLHRCNIKQPEDIQRIIRVASQNQVEGMVFTPPCDNAPEIVEALNAMRFPFVQLTPYERSNRCSWVAATDEQGAADATRHLLALGHTRIGVIQGNPDHQASWDRLRGVEAALHEAGLTLDPALVRQGDWTFDAGMAAAGELLTLPAPPTAIFAGNDEAAAGALQAAWTLHLRCPEDIAIVGFDDSPVARQLCPPLTTVRQPIGDIARAAMTLLINELIEGDGAVKNMEVPTELVTRWSTASRG
jgi:LacI family transcriptional regulator